MSKINKIIHFITDNEINDLIEAVLNSDKNTEDIIKQCLEARKEFGLKIQKIVEALQKKV